MKNIISEKRPSFLSVSKMWITASILALLLYFALDWFSRRLFPSVVDDFVHPLLLRMQFMQSITIILIMIIALLLDRAYSHRSRNDQKSRRGEAQGSLLPLRPPRKIMKHQKSNEAIQDEITYSVKENLPIIHLFLLDTKDKSLWRKVLLVFGLALHLLLIGYLAYIGHQQFIESLDLLIGGPGPIIMIEPVVLLTNSLLLFCIIVNNYFWSPVWGNRLYARYGLVIPSLLLTIFRLMILIFSIWLFKLSIIREEEFIPVQQITSTFILCLLAGISIFPSISWRLESFDILRDG